MRVGVAIPEVILARSQAPGTQWSISLLCPTVADMGKLAQEALGCHAELLCGGLGGPNRHRVLQHLVTGHPLLIPYPRAWRWAGQG